MRLLTYYVGDEAPADRKSLFPGAEKALFLSSGVVAFFRPLISFTSFSFLFSAPHYFPAQPDRWGLLNPWRGGYNSFTVASGIPRPDVLNPLEIIVQRPRTDASLPRGSATDATLPLPICWTNVPVSGHIRACRQEPACVRLENEGSGYSGQR